MFYEVKYTDIKIIDLEWRPIVGYEDIYEISNYGVVRGLDRILTDGRKWRGRFKQSRKNKNNYQQVGLYSNGKRKNLYIHRLVTRAFIPNDENKLEVNHIDGNKLNNYVGNLEWCSRSENEVHAWRNGLKENTRKSISEISKKYCSKRVYCIELNKEFESAAEAERQTGVASQHISKCCLAKRKSAGKHSFSGKKLTWMHTNKN